MRVVAQICTNEIAPQRWRNGGGWTQQLLTWPPSTPDWQLRISLATISAAGPFSSFPGVRRTLALVSGEGLLLTLDGHEHRLQVDSEPLQFDGTAAAHAVPQGGETTDLNLMTTLGHGEMLRTASAPHWRSLATQRGLYTTAAGTLYSDAAGGMGAGVAVPAATLLWLCEAAGLTLRFAPDAAATTAPSWWLGYAP